MLDKNDFLIDVAKERTYQNQSDIYNEEYAKWRSDENNPYAYNFIHDTREHSYVDGEGYLTRKADVAERMALYKCLGLLGICMIIMLVIDVAGMVLLSTLFPNFDGNILYRSGKIVTKNDIPFNGALIACLMNVLKYLIPAIIFKKVTKLPDKVVFARSSKNSQFVSSAIVISLVVVVLGRVGNYLISFFFGFVHLDVVYAYMINSSDYSVMIISAVVNCLIIPVVCEIFFRGVILQNFRQFGDSYAILVSCIAYGFSFYDLSNMGYAICFSVVLGLFTIRTGSLFTAILMNISASFVNYSLSYFAMMNSAVGGIVESVICTIIVGVSILAYTRLTSKGNWSFNISADISEMTYAKKIRIMLSTNSIAVWLVSSVVMTVVCMRILK